MSNYNFEIFKFLFPSQYSLFKNKELTFKGKYYEIFITGLKRW